MANWREITGYEGKYLVSDEGEVYSLPRIIQSGNKKIHKSGHLLKPGKRGRGDAKYYFVVLCSDGSEKHVSVHRLVAEAFLENPNNYPEINHIDENKFNNRLENLEWCDRKYNIEYSKNKQICQYTIDGEFIAEYRSILYASSITGISRTAIGNNLNGWSKNAGGFIWKFSDK